LPLAQQIKSVRGFSNAKTAKILQLNARCARRVDALELSGSKSILNDYSGGEVIFGVADALEVPGGCRVLNDRSGRGLM